MDEKLKFPNELDYENISQTFIGSERNKNVSASFLRIKRDYLHTSRNHFALLYLLRGKGKYIDVNGEEYQLQTGNLVFRRPDVKHSIIRDHDGEWLEFAVTFSKQIYETLITLEIIDTKRDVLDIGIDQLKLDKLCRFTEKISSYTPSNFPALILDLQNLFYNLTTEFAEHDSAEFIQNKLKEACRYLSEDLDKPLTIPECAEKLGLGYHLFRKEFRENMGLSPKAYRVNKRIELAQNMMRDDSLSLKEIAAKLNYPDFATFAKQYKRVTGISPAVFRKSEEHF